MLQTYEERLASDSRWALSEGSRHFERQRKLLRDAQLGVRIEFIVTGQYPGDGKPKPVAFPQPEDVSVEQDGISC